MQDVRETDELLVALAHERLGQARRAAREGRFEEALAGYEWFHEHALDGCDASLYGVRLSFALAYWRDLAALFEPAKTALLHLRDSKVKVIEQGLDDRELLHDLIALQDYLIDIDEMQFAYPLIVTVCKRNLTFAQQNWRILIPTLVSHGNYALAFAVYGEFESKVKELVLVYQQELIYGKDVSDFAANPDEWHAFVEHATTRLVDEINSLLTTVSREGLMEQATKLRAMTLHLISDAQCKLQIDARLSTVFLPLAKTVMLQNDTSSL